MGWCFIALAVYIVYESGSTLIRHEAPERSIPGIIVAAVSVVVMPLLARAKRRPAYGRVNLIFTTFSPDVPSPLNVSSEAVKRNFTTRLGLS